MTYIDKIIEKNMENETAETYIENFRSLHWRCGILGSPNDKTRMLFRLLKNSERDSLFSDSIQTVFVKWLKQSFYFVFLNFQL